MTQKEWDKIPSFAIIELRNIFNDRILITYKGTYETECSYWCTPNFAQKDLYDFGTNYHNYDLVSILSGKEVRNYTRFLNSIKKDNEFNITDYLEGKIALICTDDNKCSFLKEYNKLCLMIYDTNSSRGAFTYYFHNKNDINNKRYLCDDQKYATKIFPGIKFIEFKDFIFSQTIPEINIINSKILRTYRCS